MFAGRTRLFGRQWGVTLVELIVFIVIVTLSIAGVLSVTTKSTKHSADPMIRKQALDIADSLMEEIFLHAFTFCDPDDEAVTQAADATACTVQEGMGPEGGGSTAEARINQTIPFDNVNDYNGFTMNGITDLTGAAVPGLAGYNARVAVAEVGATYSLAAADALQVTVTVTNGNVSVPVSAVRFRYAPNDAP